MVDVQGPVAFHLGCLAALLERTDDAGGHFAEALAVSQRMDFPYWEARTQIEYGTAAFERSPRAMPTEPRVMLAAALETARRYGFNGLVEVIEARSGRPCPPSRSTGDSVRESDCVSLALTRGAGVKVTGNDSMPPMKLTGRFRAGSSVANVMIGKAREELLEHRPQLQPGELVAQAEVGAEAERHVRVRAARPMSKRSGSSNTSSSRLAEG